MKKCLMVQKYDNEFFTVKTFCLIVDKSSQNVIILYFSRLSKPKILNMKSISSCFFASFLFSISYLFVHLSVEHSLWLLVLCWCWLLIDWTHPSYTIKITNVVCGFLVWRKWRVLKLLILTHLLTHCSQISLLCQSHYIFPSTFSNLWILRNIFDLLSFLSNTYGYVATLML